MIISKHHLYPLTNSYLIYSKHQYDWSILVHTGPQTFSYNFHITYIEVSQNGGTPKSSVFNHFHRIFHEINHPAIRDPPFMEPPIWIISYVISHHKPSLATINHY